ncbi:hypothetical protein [Methylocystis sp. JR02]|uniref:hypothetical protein n=1 Tax=Methylocystis sp. JR02 TaxID=3046284 RepID=UPI0024B9896D|nr:hypothetical protein [Methylocystis sp. JR02]MDJ0447167.1 hypothetical protein [Methylocystis sp. JR02]
MTTGQRTKFNNADDTYMEYFRLSSEIFARAFDRIAGVCSEKTNSELLEKFSYLDATTSISHRLRHLNMAREQIDHFNGGVVLKFAPDGSLTVFYVPRFENAMEFYFKIEKSNPDDDVVLVNSSEAGHIRSAYRNYFSDTSEFLSLLESARTIISEDGDGVAYEPG